VTRGSVIGNKGVPGRSIQLDISMPGARLEDPLRLAVNAREPFLDARVSQTMTGFKSWLLKPFDSLFRRAGAGAIIPITIKRPRTGPMFGMNLKKALLRKS